MLLTKIRFRPQPTAKRLIQRDLLNRHEVGKGQRCDRRIRESVDPDVVLLVPATLSSRAHFWTKIGPDVRPANALCGAGELIVLTGVTKCDLTFD